VQEPQLFQRKGGARQEPKAVVDAAEGPNYPQVFPGRYWCREANTPIVVRQLAVNSPTLATRGARVVMV